MQNPQGQRGYTIAELAISITIMLIIMAIAMRFMTESFNVSHVTSEMTEAQQNLRTAHDFIARDLKGAGDGMEDIVSPRLLKTFLTKYLTTEPVNDASDTALGVLGVFTSDDDPPTGTAVPVPSPSPGTNISVLEKTDRLTVMKLDTWPETCLNPPLCYVSLPVGAVTGNGLTAKIPTGPNMLQFSIGDIYFFTSSGGSAFGSVTAVDPSARTVTFGAGDRFGLNKVATSGPIYLATNGKTSTLMRMQIIHYYIDADKMLRRRVYGIGGAGGYTDTAVAEHIANLRVRYILGESAANGNVAAPVDTLVSEDKQGLVRQVEVTVTAETTHNVVVKSGKQVKQELSMTGTTTVRNMQFNKHLKMSQ